MSNNRKIVINGVDYVIYDVLSGIIIEDAAVCKGHKIGSGHGERKIYLQGNEEEKYRFFEGFTCEIKGFLLKENLREYLIHAKSEFYKPTQDYMDKASLKKKYKSLVNMVDELPNVLEFEVIKAPVKHPGIYLNHGNGRKKDRNWNLIGDIALPRISRLSILKLEKEKHYWFYFKMSFGIEILEEDEDDALLIEKIENSKLSPTVKEAVIKARIGQGTYRKKLLEECSTCPFTLVDDERLLIASHIKPWKGSNNAERRDPKNGFVFTPTYDKLFDRGYISFEDDKRLIISPWLSQYNRERLKLEEDVVIENLPCIDVKRARYLEYHRRCILKKVEEL